MGGEIAVETPGAKLVSNAFTMVSFSSLPIDVLLHIFRDLDPSNVARTELVSRPALLVSTSLTFFP